MRAFPKRRVATWIATIGTAGLFAGAAGGAWAVTSQRTGPPALADGRAGAPTLAYDCRFPAGRYQVAARIVASYPLTAVTGRAFRPASLSLALTVPDAPLAGLGQPGETVTVSARLATSGVSGNGSKNDGAAPVAAASTRAASSAWASLVAVSARLSKAGQDLGVGPLRPVTPLPALTTIRAGTMNVAAGSLRLLFAPVGARATASPVTTARPVTTASPTTTARASAPAPSPSPVRAAVAAACTLKPGQDAALATIVVRGALANLTAKPLCPREPNGGLKLNPSFPLPSPPRGATILHNAPGADPACTYLVGYNDLLKSNSAAELGPGVLDVSIGDRVARLGYVYYQVDSAAQFEYKSCGTCPVVHALPPAQATYLDFGFMPVSATLQLTQVGTMNIIGLGTGITLTDNTSYSYMELRIYNVKVNGQPLNVGNHCETEKPFKVKVTGLVSGPHAYSLQAGGALAGEVAIPSFTGCGVTEDLDHLITGTVSGKDNYTLFTQGALCTPAPPPSGCPLTVPKPLR